MLNIKLCNYVLIFLLPLKNRPFFFFHFAVWKKWEVQSSSFMQRMITWFHFLLPSRYFRLSKMIKCNWKDFFLVATSDGILFFGVAFCFRWTQLTLLSSYSCMRLQWVPRMQSESSWSPLTDLRDTCTTVYTETPNCLASYCENIFHWWY